MKQIDGTLHDNSTRRTAANETQNMDSLKIFRWREGASGEDGVGGGEERRERQEKERTAVGFASSEMQIRLHSMHIANAQANDGKCDTNECNIVPIRISGGRGKPLNKRTHRRRAWHFGRSTARTETIVMYYGSA